MNETSLSLLDRVRRNEDEHAWEELYGLYSPLLRQWLKKFHVQSADVDDLVQEVLTAVLKELPNFTHNERPGAFRKWLKVTLIHRLQNFWRASKHDKQQLDLSRLEELSNDQSGLSQLWNEEHDRFVLAELLNRVRPHFQDQTWEAFRLQFYDNQSVPEVAKHLGMSTNSVYVARSRVLSALRRESVGLVE